MKIAYFFHTDPQTEKVVDTVKTLKGSLGFIHALTSNGNQPHLMQKTWDDQELQRMERDKEKGIILSYRVMEA